MLCRLLKRRSGRRRRRRAVGSLYLYRGIGAKVRRLSWLGYMD